MYKFSSSRARLVLLTLLCASSFVVGSAQAILVTWNLNPDGLDQPVGSSSTTVTEYGYSIVASGYTANGSGAGSPLELYFKNQGFDEVGLGIVGPPDHELQGIGGAPAQFIQLDLSSILARGGVTGGMLQVGSVQSGSSDTFTIYGSNIAGTLGTQIGKVYDSSSDQLFISIPDFGAYKYISIGALSGDVLPMAFQANCTAVPEVGALLPILGLFSVIGVSRLLRRRAVA